MESGLVMSHLFIGGAVGFASAVIGGALQYRISSKKNDSPRASPGCMFIVAGSLGLIGLLMAAASLLLTGGIGLVLHSGIGVLVGFFAGFALMVLVWFMLFNRH